MNKENAKLERQVEILKGDSNGNMAMAQYDAMKKDIDDLMFENSTLQKDYKEATKVLAETQEKLAQKVYEEHERQQKEREAALKMKQQQSVLEETQMKQAQSNEQNQNLRSAFNADRKVL